MKQLFCLLACLVLTSAAFSLELTHSPATESVVESTRPTVTVFLPMGLSLPLDKAQLWVNGEEVTEQCQRTQAFVNYRPPADLPLGNCTVRFALEPYDQSWTFSVSPKTYIKSLDVQAPVNVSEFDKVEVTMRAPSGQQCWYEVDGVDGQQPFAEESPGVYRGHFAIPGGFPKIKLLFTGFLRRGSVLESRVAKAIPLTTAGFRLIIKEPTQETITGEDLRVVGQTRSDVLIRYRIDLVFRDGIETGTLPKSKWQTVQSDSKGGFVIDYKKGARLPRLDLLMTIMAEDAEGNRSQAVGLHLHYDDSTPLYNPVKNRVDKP